MSQKDRTERLLNLLFALMASSRPVPKSFLRDAVEGYRESPSDEAFERMFERDKEELRSMGVPIITVEGSDGSGGIEGYRVAASEYALPDVALSTDELAVVGVAARVWEQASLGPAAQSALRKLEAAGGSIVEGPVGIETRVSTAEPSFPAFWEAVRLRRAVAFDYRRPDDSTAATRTVQPWGVTSRRGHWYLIGHDVDRGAPRVFRLSRVVGDVTSLGQPGAYEVPSGIDVASLVASVTPDPGSLVAEIRVRADRAHGLRRRATAVDTGEGFDLILVPFSDDEVLARELVGLGADAVVLAPTALREAVVRRLSAAAGEVA